MQHTPTTDPPTKGTSTLKVLLVDDDPFTRAMVSDVLRAAGMEVRCCASASEAVRMIGTSEPNVVMTDLDLGLGPTGADLLRKIEQNWPWIGMVALTAHASVELAVGERSALPTRAKYVVKGQLSSMDVLVESVEGAILPVVSPNAEPHTQQGTVVTPAQASAIRLIAEGMSNSAIAERRGITLRSAESLVHRSFQALGLADRPDINPRVVAAMMWRNGQIIVRGEAPSPDKAG